MPVEKLSFIHSELYREHHGTQNIMELKLTIIWTLCDISEANLFLQYLLLLHPDTSAEHNLLHPP